MDTKTKTSTVEINQHPKATAKPKSVNWLDRIFKTTPGVERGMVFTFAIIAMLATIAFSWFRHEYTDKWFSFLTLIVGYFLGTRKSP